MSVSSTFKFQHAVRSERSTLQGGLPIPPGLNASGLEPGICISCKFPGGAAGLRTTLRQSSVYCSLLRVGNCNTPTLVFHINQMLRPVNHTYVIFMVLIIKVLLFSPPHSFSVGD